MNALRKLIALLLFAMSPTMAFAITFDQLVAYAEANFPTIFTGTAAAGQYLQYNFRYYAASGNYLAIDNANELFVLGPYTGWAVVSVGPMINLAPIVTAWEATQAAAGSTAGACTLQAQPGDPSYGSICTAYPAGVDVTTVCNLTLPIYGGAGLSASCAPGYTVRCKLIGYDASVTTKYYYGGSSQAARQTCQLMGGTEY